MDRAILHVDMDAFFASVEQRDDSALRGKPVLVGGSGPRGVVAAASYEARAFGCRSAQPMAMARRMCPHAIVVKGDHAKYGAVSRQVFAILESFTPLVEPLSIDEAFLDVTASQRLFGPAVEIAQRIRTRVRAETALTASVGVAPNKFLAKLASDLDKPDGLTVLTMDDVPGRIAALPIERMWGVGPSTAARLRGLGLATFGDIQRADERTLRRLLGAAAGHFRRLAHGLDDREVHVEHDVKSVSHEETFPRDLESPDAVRAVVVDQAERVAARLRRHDRLARTVTLKIRDGAFATITRSRTLPSPTDETRELIAAATAIFDEWARAAFVPVRLVGTAAHNLEERAATQLELFDAETHERTRRLDAATDAITAKFGRRSIRRGGGREK